MCHVSAFAWGCRRRRRAIMEPEAQSWPEASSELPAPSACQAPAFLYANMPELGFSPEPTAVVNSTVEMPPVLSGQAQMQPSASVLPPNAAESTRDARPAFWDENLLQHSVHHMPTAPQAGSHAVSVATLTPAPPPGSQVSPCGVILNISASMAGCCLLIFSC